MKKVLLIGTSINTNLRDRVSDKVEGHPLYGALCLHTNEKAVISVYRDFIKVGADILITNTYQASLDGFQKHLGLSEKESYDLFKKSVLCCRKAIEAEQSETAAQGGKEILVFGALGSFGACLADGSEYTGEFMKNYDLKYIESVQRTRVQALVDGGVDGILFATIPTSAEAELIVNLLKEFPNLKTMVSFSCKDSQHLGSGENFRDAALRCWKLNSSQLLAIGVNCLPADRADDLLSTISDDNIPLIVITFTEKVWDNEGRKWQTLGEEPVGLYSYIPQWCAKGVKVIGGCCETSFETLRRIRGIVDEINAST